MADEKQICHEQFDKVGDFVGLSRRLCLTNSPILSSCLWPLCWPPVVGRKPRIGMEIGGRQMMSSLDETNKPRTIHDEQYGAYSFSHV